MVSGYLNANRVSEAIELSNSMPHRNTMSWTTMITGLAQNKMARLAREYFDRMPNKDVVAWNPMITYVDEGLAAEPSELLFDAGKKYRHLDCDDWWLCQKRSQRGSLKAPNFHASVLL